MNLNQAGLMSVYIYSIIYKIQQYKINPNFELVSLQPANDNDSNNDSFCDLSICLETVSLCQIDQWLGDYM